MNIHSISMYEYIICINTPVSYPVLHAGSFLRGFNFVDLDMPTCDSPTNL